MLRCSIWPWARRGSRSAHDPNYQWVLSLFEMILWKVHHSESNPTSGEWESRLDTLLATMRWEFWCRAFILWVWRCGKKHGGKKGNKNKVHEYELRCRFLWSRDVTRSRVQCLESSQSSSAVYLSNDHLIWLHHKNNARDEFEIKITDDTWNIEKGGCLIHCQSIVVGERICFSLKWHMCRGLLLDQRNSDVYAFLSPREKQNIRTQRTVIRGHKCSSMVGQWKCCIVQFTQNTGNRGARRALLEHQAIKKSAAWLKNTIFQLFAKSPASLSNFSWARWIGTRIWSVDLNNFHQNLVREARDLQSYRDKIQLVL